MISIAMIHIMLRRLEKALSRFADTLEDYGQTEGRRFAELAKDEANEAESKMNVRDEPTSELSSLRHTRRRNLHGPNQRSAHA